MGLWAAQNWDLVGQFNYVSPITAKFDWMTFSQPNCGSDLNKTVPVYRMWSPANKDHFYTTSYYEYTTTAVNFGYKQEGILVNMFSSPQTGITPVYRMYSPANKDHFYTTSYYEYTVTAVNFGYNQEGILGYGIPYVGLAKEDEIPQVHANATEMELDTVSAEVT